MKFLNENHGKSRKRGKNFKFSTWFERGIYFSPTNEDSCSYSQQVPKCYDPVVYVKFNRIEYKIMLFLIPYKLVTIQNKNKK